MKEEFGQHNKNGFRIGDRDAISFDVGSAKDSQADRTQHRYRHPTHPDIPGLGHLINRTHRHEANDDMRLTEIPEPPGDGRQEPKKGQPIEE